MEEQKGGLLVVMAHPDDESMGSGGLILRHTRAGIATHLICATYGEAGWTGKPPGAKKEDLAEIRAKELEEAAAALALSGVELWDYPDGGVTRSDQQEITQRVWDEISKLRPRVVVGWGPDGAYGHPDHFASSRPHRQGSAGRVRMSAYSSTVRAMIEYLEPVLSFVSEGEAGDAALSAEASDLQFGNPQEMPLPEIQQALAKWAAPQNKDWFAYKFSDPKAIQVAVESLRKLTGIDFDPADVSMTTGAFGGLASTLRAVLDPGDEVIYLSPPWFFHVPMIISNGAKAIRVDFEPPKFELPVDAIEWHITSRTRAIIVNTPHNPSGRVFTPDELESLADVLHRAHHPIYLISDESYNRILYDGRKHESPVRYYDRSCLIYTYGKTLA